MSWIEVGSRRQSAIEASPERSSVPAGRRIEVLDKIAAAAAVWRNRPDQQAALSLVRATYPEFFAAVAQLGVYWLALNEVPPARR